MLPLLAALPQDEDVGASLAQIATTPAGQATIALEVSLSLLWLSPDAHAGTVRGCMQEHGT
jgi:hypothetical protein